MALMCSLVSWDTSMCGMRATSHLAGMDGAFFRSPHRPRTEKDGGEDGMGPIGDQRPKVLHASNPHCPRRYPERAGRSRP